MTYFSSRFRMHTVAGAALLSGLFAAKAARADCVVSGKTMAQPHRALYADDKGKTKLLTFARQAVSVRLHFPTKPAKFLKVTIESPSSGLKVTGYVKNDTFLVRNTKDIDIRGVASLPANSLSVPIVERGGKIFLSHRTNLPFEGKVGVVTSCSDLDFGAPQGYAPKVSRRGAVRKVIGPIDLFANAKDKGKPALKLSPIGGAEIFVKVLAASRRKVHIQLFGRLKVDAWVPSKQLQFVSKRHAPRDGLIPPDPYPSRSKLKLNQKVPETTLNKQLTLYIKDDAKSMVVGSVPAGSKVLLLRSRMKWANLAPKGLEFLPEWDSGLWARIKE